MAITDMPERFTLGEVEVALEVKRIRFMHQSVLKDEISNIIHDPRGGMGQKLQLGRLEEIIVFAGTKSLRLKGPSDDPDLEGWKTVNLPSSNTFSQVPDYEDDEYASRFVSELIGRILKHNRFIVQDENFGRLFRGYLTEEEENEPDPTPSPASGETSGGDTSTGGAESTSVTPDDQESPPTQGTIGSLAGSTT